MDGNSAPSGRKLFVVRHSKMRGVGKMSSGALLETRQTAAEYIAGVVRGYFANDNSAVKRIARVVRREERTAESYFQGRTCPGVPEFLRLAQEIPELRSAVAELLRLDLNRDPRALKILDYVQRVIAQHPEEGDQA